MGVIEDTVLVAFRTLRIALFHESRKNVILTVLFTIKVRLQPILVFLSVTYAFMTWTCLLLRTPLSVGCGIELVHVEDAGHSPTRSG